MYRLIKNFIQIICMIQIVLLTLHTKDNNIYGKEKRHPKNQRTDIYGKG